MEDVYGQEINARLGLLETELDRLGRQIHQIGMILAPPVEPTGCWILCAGNGDAPRVVCAHNSLLGIEQDGLPRAEVLPPRALVAYAAWVHMGGDIAAHVRGGPAGVGVVVYARDGGYDPFHHMCDTCGEARSVHRVAGCRRAGGNATHRVCDRCHAGDLCEACARLLAAGR